MDVGTCTSITIWRVAGLDDQGSSYATSGIMAELARSIVLMLMTYQMLRRRTFEALRIIATI